MKIPGWTPQDIAAQQARQREQARQEAERLEREEKRLLQEAEAEADRLAPPAERPELPPAEVARRLELLEAQRPGPGGVRTDPGVDGRYRRRDRLRRVRLQKEVQAQDARDQQHIKRIAKVTAKLEAQIQEAEAQRTALVDRHAVALAEIDGTLSDLRRMLSCIGCLALTLIVLAPSASAESLAVCQLRSTAQFSPGLTLSSQPFLYTFRGKLEACRESHPSGNIEAGKTLVERVINSTTGLEDEVTYREPFPSGSGSCASSTTSGTALTSWADGTYTVMSYSTEGGRASVLSGKVVESMTLTAINAKPGDPTTYTITTNQFAGDAVLGLVKIEPDPELCTTPLGAQTGGFNGEVAIGTP